MKDGKFEVGDKLECLTNYHGQFTKGLVYSFREYIWNGRGVGIVEDDGGSETNGSSLFDWKLAAPERVLLANGFAVGDRVFYIQDWRPAKGVKKYGTVIDDVAGGLVWAMWDRDDGLPVKGNMPANRVFLADEQNKEIERNDDMPVIKFNPGDRVRRIGGDFGRIMVNGNIYVVKEHKPIGLQLENVDRFWASDKFALVIDEPVVAAPVLEWKIGARVRLIKLPADARGKGRGPEIGMLGTVKNSPDAHAPRIEFDDVIFDGGKRDWWTRKNCLELIPDVLAVPDIPVMAAPQFVVFIFASKGGKYYGSSKHKSIEDAHKIRDEYRRIHETDNIYAYVMTEVI